MDVAAKNTLRIDWSHRPVLEWRNFLRRVPRSNWLQTLTLSKVLNDRLNKTTKMGLVLIDETPVGMINVQQAHIGPFRLVEIFRGPLWFDNALVGNTYASDKLTVGLAHILDRTYPKGFFTRRRWLPEIAKSDDVLKELRDAGFKSKRGRDYATSWVYLGKSLDELRAKLDRKWRNALKKSEQSKLELRLDEQGTTIDSFVSFHTEDQTRKAYHGRNGAFLAQELANAAMFREVVLAYAVFENEPIAGVAIVLHGNSATYRASWSQVEGRKRNAHNFLLWNGVIRLKERGVQWLDLGGTSGANTEGLAKFKHGMGGEEWETCGVLG